MKLLINIVFLASAFLAGFLTHSLVWYDRGNITTKQEDPPIERIVVRSSSTQMEGNSKNLLQLESKESRQQDKDVIRLSSTVVKALVSGGNFDVKLVRMGLTEHEIGEVNMIRDKGMMEFKSIEINHSKVISDEKGERVEISPFPSERGRWLNDIENRLDKLLQDDRSVVVANMIALADNDEDVGLYRRELLVIGDGNEGEKIKIEERTFDDTGRHTDSDYEIVDSRSKSRWNHLLDFGDK